MSRRAWAIALTAAAAAGVAWRVTPAITNDQPNSTALTHPIHTESAIVERTDVASRQTSIGTLAYAGAYAISTQLPAGITTWLPQTGTIIRRGQPVFEVDGSAVRLLYGNRPAWREFQFGMARGPDVTELERNLEALGFDPAHEMTVDDHFSLSTAAAVSRWQQSLGQPATGAIPAGQVVFSSGPIRVNAVAATLGSPIAAGTTMLNATSTDPIVSVALDVASQGLIHRGNRVLVTIPGRRPVGGRVIEVSHVAVPSTDSSQPDSGPVIPVTIALNQPATAFGFDQAPVQVTITQREHRGVLAVPITSLLAQTEGYAVETLGTAGPRLIPVTTGLFDDASGLVEVAGPGLIAGQRVETARQ